MVSARLCFPTFGTKYVVSYGQTQIDEVAYAQYDIFRLENEAMSGALEVIRKSCLR